MTTLDKTDKISYGILIAVLLLLGFRLGSQVHYMEKRLCKYEIEYCSKKELLELIEKRGVEK